MIKRRQTMAMKILAALLLMITLITAQEMRSWPSLTVGETTYINVKLTKIEPDGIRILHDGGVAKIKIERLPEELRQELGLTEANAKAYREKGIAARKARIAKEKAEYDASEAARKERAALANLQYNYIVLKVERVLPNGDLLCYRHQDGGVAGSAALALNSIRRRSDRVTHVESYTEYDKPYYLTGVPRKFGEGEVIRGKAAKAGIKELDGRTYVWLIAAKN